MTGFMDSTAGHFGYWAFPLIMRDTALDRMIMENPEIDGTVKEHFAKWVETFRGNYSEIEGQLNNAYKLRALEMLRAETCFCIIQGQWQSAVCLTNILLEAFLKLALVYSDVVKGDGQGQPAGDLGQRYSGPMAKFMKLDLGTTINMARRQGLISKEAKKALGEFRERFRNAFFHADMHAMFGDQTIPVTMADLGTFTVEEPKQIPIRDLPLLLGEAMWRNAEVNAIPYFKTVDGLIRATLPKIFPNQGQERPKNPDEGT